VAVPKYQWTDWRNLGDWHNEPAKDEQGLYQMRLVTAAGTVIPMARVGGVDQEGICFIGRTSRKGEKKEKTFAKQIKAFLEGRHPGANLYFLVEDALRDHFKEHRLQFRVRVIDEEEIDKSETVLMRLYYERFCELPPGNRGLPIGYEIALED